MNRYAYVVKTSDPIDPPLGSRVRIAAFECGLHLIELPDQPGIVWPMPYDHLDIEPQFKPSQVALSRLSPVGTFQFTLIAFLEGEWP